MIGLFKANVVGKNANASKSGKIKYFFINGISDEKTGLLDKCSSFEYWSDKEYDFEFMQPVTVELDIQGDFIQVLKIIEG